MNDLIGARRPSRMARPSRPWLSRAKCPCHDGPQPLIVVNDTGKEALCQELLRQSAELSRGGRSMGVGKSRRAPLVVLGREDSRIGKMRAGSAGRSPQWSPAGEIWTVELSGISGDREHAPPAQGPDRSGRSGRPLAREAMDEGPIRVNPDRARTRRCRGSAPRGGCSRPELCAGNTALTAASTSHATADEPTQRQRKTRVIAMGRPYDREIVDKMYGQTGRD